jgi:hypothetical protein
LVLKTFLKSTALFLFIIFAY